MRKKLFKWHSISALIALIPLILISVTGSILVFKTEIDRLLMPEHVSVFAQPNQRRLSLNTLVEKIEQVNPNHILGSWEIFDDKTRAETAYIVSKETGYWYKQYLNQYTGEILSSPVLLTHDLTDWLVSLHYTFLLDFTGTVLGSIFAIVLLFLAISGVILHRQFWKKLFTLRFSAAKRVFFSDVHKMIGIFSAPVLLVLAFTGGYYNIAAVAHEVEEHIEPHPVLKEPLYAETIDFQSLLDQTSKDINGYRATYFTFPFEPELHISFYGEVPSNNPLASEYASIITYDRQTGKLMSAYDIRSANSVNKTIDSFRKLHFGYFGGLASKVIWCVLGLAPLWLALTGLYFYWFRKSKRKMPSSKTALA